MIISSKINTVPLLSRRANAFEETRCGLGSRGSLQDHSSDLIRVSIDKKEEKRLTSGNFTVSDPYADGIPAFIWVLAINQSSTEKKGWVPQIATRSRPVAARASLMAAVVTSEPFLANFTMSAPEICSTKSSAARSSQTDGREVDSLGSRVADGSHDRTVTVTKSD